MEDLESNVLFPSDKGYYSDNISDALKLKILNIGPCKPSGPFPENEDKRKFSKFYYFKKTSDGQKLPRTWLCYSNKDDVAYCEACWLFADRSVQSFSDSWVKGIKNWQKLSTKIKVHELSQCHLNACLVYDTWKKGSTVDTVISNQWKEKVNFWKQVLHRIVNVTLTLASCNLAFRGHREKIGKPHSGNFLAVVELLSKYDPVLAKLIDKNKQIKINYLSPDIQNELISLLTMHVRRKIIENIKANRFYSIILDTTQDISKCDQLSITLRYVSMIHDADGLTTNLKICESFLGFIEVKDQSAAGLEIEVLKFLEDTELLLKWCRGQGYDGANVMSGKYNGLQKKISDVEKNALYVHCGSHNLNLVLNDSVKGVISVKKFFATVEKLYVFFGASIKLWQLLQETSCTENEVQISLKKLCPTRWSSRRDALFAVRYNYLYIVKALTKIVLVSKEKDEKTNAKGLLKQLEKFEFIFLVVMQCKILDCVDLVSKTLQKEDMDLSQAVDLLKTLHENLQAIRNFYGETKKEAKYVAKFWKVKAIFEKKKDSKSD